MMHIIPDFDLQPYNSLALAARAKFFVEVSDNESLVDALKFAKEGALPLLLLGGGSNLVLADDFPGLAIQVKHSGIEIVDEDEDFVWLQVGAGENWHQLVQHCLDFHYWGLENLSLIPGNVGAAPIQNIGAYGVELADVFSELQAMDIQSRLLVTFEKEACEFAYRHSIFKGRLNDRYVITRVTLKLRKEPQLNLEYPALSHAIDKLQLDSPGPADVAAVVCRIRQSKLPDPNVLPNAGSFFKNPVIDAVAYETLKEKFPDVVVFPAGDCVKVAAGWLIDQAGFKGFSSGPVRVHDKQALVLTNPGDGNGRDILRLANMIQEKVRALYKIELEIEPRVYGAPPQTPPRANT